MANVKSVHKSTFTRMAAFIKPYAIQYLIGVIGMGLLGFSQNYIIAMGFKDLTNALLLRNTKGLVYTGIFMVAAICVIGSLEAFCSFWAYSYYREIGGGVRKELFKNIIRLPMRFIENAHSGDLFSRINNDMWQGLSIFGDPVCLMFRAILLGGLSGLSIFVLNWILGLIALGFGLITVVCNVCFRGVIRRTVKLSREKLSQTLQIITDIIMGNQIIKIFNLQKHFVQNFENASDDLLHKSMKVVKIQSLLSGFNSLGFYFNYVGILIAGCLLVLNHQTTFGTLVAIIAFTDSFVGMFRSIGYYVVTVNGGLSSIDRLFELIDEPKEDELHRKRAESKDAGTVTVESCEPVPALEINNITFSYKNRTTVLDRFSLNVNKDQVVAVVGSSGSGKSTLFKLLLGFYESDAGNIKIFGKSFYDYTLSELRDFMAYVPQESYLFSGTIRDNIGWGKQDASEAEIVNAAKMAYADEFITKLPDGYDTEVGERGSRLSGGERQRIAIARALLKNAPILLLDEATSSLDSESEQQVQKALEVLMKGRTTMVIAHRLSTIQNADRIIVLDNGKMREDGTHNSLLAQNGFYSYLYNLQFTGDALPAS